MRRRGSIPQRRPVFIGCEGTSEQSYARLLQGLVDDAELHVHLEISNLGRGAGDPLARVELAIQRLKQLRRTRIAPRERFVMLDHDQVVLAPDRAARACQLAENYDIKIVWQRPCFEAMLLRHLPARAAHQPPNKQLALQALLHDWPHYQKPMMSAALSRRIDLDAVLRAATVENELAAMLGCIGLL